MGENLGGNRTGHSPKNLGRGRRNPLLGVEEKEELSEFKNPGPAKVTMAAPTSAAS